MQKLVDDLRSFADGLEVGIVTDATFKWASQIKNQNCLSDLHYQAFGLEKVGTLNDAIPRVKLVRFTRVRDANQPLMLFIQQARQLLDEIISARPSLEVIDDADEEYDPEGEESHAAQLSEANEGPVWEDPLELGPNIWKPGLSLRPGKDIANDLRAVARGLEHHGLPDCTHDHAPAPKGANNEKPVKASTAVRTSGLTVTHAAKMARVHKGTITRLANDGNLKSVGNGRRRRIDAESLSDYMLNRPTRAEVSESAEAVKAKFREIGLE